MAEPTTAELKAIWMGKEAAYLEARKARDRASDAFYELPDSLRLKKLIEDKRKQRNKLSLDMDKREHVIGATFLTEYPEGRWHMARYASSVNNNIKEEVLGALKEKFVFKMLSNGSIEDIVNRMISLAIEEDEVYKGYKAQQDGLRDEEDELEDSLSDAHDAAVKAEEDALRHAGMQAHDAEQVYKDRVKADLTDSAAKNAEHFKELPLWEKRRVLEKYRQQCLSRVGEVWELLKARRVK